MYEEAQDGWSVLEKAVELSRAGERFVLATVVWRQGPSSGKAGSKAIVTESGEVHGWIGGACAEPVLIREALAALEHGEPKLLLLGMEDVMGDVPDGMVSVPISCQSDGALQVHIEPVIPTPTVVVVGRSPMAHTLVELVDALGWHGRLAESLATEEVPAGSAVVVATQGHGDEDALTAAIEAEPAWVGLVASAKRGEVVLGYLRDHGAREDRVDAVQVPAGLDLGHTTHREMAASILAELVRVRATGGLGGSSAGPVEQAATAIDPVCGMEVTADESSRPLEHDGTSYYFCCPGCRAAFAADPESYTRSVHADQE